MNKMKFDKLKSLILKLIEKSDIENKDSVESIDLVKGEHFEGYALMVEFKKNKLKSSEQEKFLDDCWRLIYDWLDTPVFLINSSKYKFNESYLVEQEKNESRELNLIHSFMDAFDSEGICGYFVIEDEKGFQVILVIDADWLKTTDIEPSNLAGVLRNQIKKEIKSWVGLDVYVGSIVKNCDGLR